MPAALHRQARRHGPRRRARSRACRAVAPGRARRTVLAARPSGPVPTFPPTAPWTAADGHTAGGAPPRRASDGRGSPRRATPRWRATRPATPRRHRCDPTRRAQPRQPSIEMAWVGHIRTASATLGRRDSGGSSARMYKKLSSRTSKISGAIPMQTALLAHLSKSTTIFMGNLPLGCARTLLGGRKPDARVRTLDRPGRALRAPTLHWNRSLHDHLDPDRRLRPGPRPARHRPRHLPAPEDHRRDRSLGGGPEGQHLSLIHISEP